MKHSINFFPVKLSGRFPFVEKVWFEFSVISNVERYSIFQSFRKRPGMLILIFDFPADVSRNFRFNGSF